MMASWHQSKSKWCYSVQQTLKVYLRVQTPELTTAKKYEAFRYRPDSCMVPERNAQEKNRSWRRENFLIPRVY